MRAIAFSTLISIFPCLITDYNMPEMSGKALSHKITTIRPDLSVLMVSANGLYANVDLKQWGVDYILIKPYRKEQLIHAVEQLLAAASDTPTGNRHYA